MALKTTVKIGRITNLSDARYGAGMGVDFLGFCFSSDSEEYIEPDEFKEIAGWVSGPHLVGEFINEQATTIYNLAKELKLEIVQVEQVHTANELSSKLKVIYRLNLETLSDKDEITVCLQNLTPTVEYVLIDSEKIPNQNQLKAIEALSSQFKILRGFDLNDESISDELDKSAVTGISLNGSQEIKAGFKDYDELADILEALELDD